MTHVGRSYCESTSQSLGWPKTYGGQFCRCGGYGKSLGVGGKMPLISLRGPPKHADYFARSGQRSFCKRPSVALWTPPTAGGQSVSQRERVALWHLWRCWWHHFWEELIWTWEACARWFISPRTHFVCVAQMLFYVFKDGKYEEDPSELQLKSEQETFIVNRPDSVRHV